MYKAMTRLYDADPGTGTGGAADTGAGSASGTSAPSIDYEKIASIVDGRMKAAGESSLKGALKKYGLSQEEMTEAIDTYKAIKAANEPDIDALNAKVAEAEKKALNAELKLEASNLANELGVSGTKVSYLLKMADTSKAVKDGKVDKTKLKESLEAVLKDIPEFKATTEDNSNGFKIGSGGSSAESDQNALNAQLAQAFGVKAK